MNTHLASEMNRMSKLEVQCGGDPLWCHLGYHMHCVTYTEQEESTEGQIGVAVQSKGRGTITPFCNSYRGFDAGRCLHATLTSVSAPVTIHRKLLSVLKHPA